MYFKDILNESESKKENDIKMLNLKHISFNHYKNLKGDHFEWSNKLQKFIKFRSNGPLFHIVDFSTGEILGNNPDKPVSKSVDFKSENAALIVAKKWIEKYKGKIYKNLEDAKKQLKDNDVEQYKALVVIQSHDY